MQVKIVIGTIAFMLTMIILGYAALREPERLEHFTHAREGRTIETGAKIYIDNCSTCHGVAAKAEECYDAGGELTGCQGVPLNSYWLVCGDQPEQLVNARFEGTKEQFIERTIAAGRSGTVMPAWAAQFGGPFRDDQVKDVAAYVLNFADDDFCSVEPSRFAWPEAVADLLVMDTEEFTAVPGDPENGAELYASTYGCSSCHGTIDEPGSNTQGPWLGDIAEVGATRVEGQTAAQYVYASILNPDAFIAPDCPNGPCTSPSAMSAGFGSRIGANSPQDMIDLLVYLVGE
ncbi:c-type cytochrome [Candidatus Leptofilum sp.]|uniref:c-type cytochrome n=1 Tax=Candidatus Leptofilum sp. TaxID=3241576 RepID=UPI003B5C7539